MIARLFTEDQVKEIECGMKVLDDTIKEHEIEGSCDYRPKLFIVAITRHEDVLIAIRDRRRLV